MNFDNILNKTFFSFFTKNKIKTQKTPEYFTITAYKQSDIRDLPIFGKISCETIKQNRSCLYYDRLFFIFQALTNIQNLDYNQKNFSIAEIGVYKGGTSHFIGSILHALDLKNIICYSFDTFEGHSSLDIKRNLDGEHKPESFNETDYQEVISFLRELENIKVIKGRFQDTSDIINDKVFGFVHLDVDIYEPTIYSLNFFNEKLVTGGCIIVDDYGFTTCPGTKKAVDEFLMTHNSFFSIHLLTGQCILIKTNNDKIL